MFATSLVAAIQQCPTNLSHVERASITKVPIIFAVRGVKAPSMYSHERRNILQC